MDDNRIATVKHMGCDSYFNTLAEQLAFAQKKALNIGHITRFLNMYNDNSAAARILTKESQSDHLVSLCQADTVNQKLSQKRRQVHNEENKLDPVMRDVSSVFDSQIKLVPHI